MNKETKHTDLRLHLLVAIILLLAAFCGGYDVAKNHFRESTQKIDTLVVERWDTAFIDRPQEIVRYVVRRDTVKVVGNSDTLTEPQIVVVNDSTVVVSISQAVYSDSTEKAKYTAYVSGYNAALDSICINCLNTETIITKTEIEKARRIGIGVQLGVGATTSGFSPYIGVGLQYRLW